MSAPSLRFPVPPTDRPGDGGGWIKRQRSGGAQCVYERRRGCDWRKERNARLHIAHSCDRYRSGRPPVGILQVIDFASPTLIRIAPLAPPRHVVSMRGCLTLPVSSHQSDLLQVRFCRCVNCGLLIGVSQIYDVYHFVHWPQNIRRQDKKDLFSILYRCSPFVTCARDEGGCIHRLRPVNDIREDEGDKDEMRRRRRRLRTKLPL